MKVPIGVDDLKQLNTEYLQQRSLAREKKITIGGRVHSNPSTYQVMRKNQIKLRPR